MAKKGSDGAGGIGCGFVILIALLAAIPKPVWITIGVVVGIALLTWFTVWAVREYEKRAAAKRQRERAEQAARAAAAKREREEKARRDKAERIKTLGKDNAAIVESALTAVKQIRTSEAARAGWLGEVDFSADIRAITDAFQKAHALGEVADKLSVLDKPGPDDRRILAEARATKANLETVACERAELIGQCATQARLIDKSLQQERKDARTAEQRAELHAQLSAMLYGIEASPQTTPTSPTADAVMARVQAYLEIKNQIQRARDTA